MPDAASRFRRLGDVVARPGAQLAMLVGAAAIAHVAVHLAARASPYLAFRVGDETYYHDWARAIAGGALLRDTAFFTSPLFAYALAALYRIAGDSIGAVQALNLVLGVGAVALTWRPPPGSPVAARRSSRERSSRSRAAALSRSRCPTRRR